MPALTTGAAAGWTSDAQFLVSDPDGTYSQAAVTLSYLLYTTILPGIPFKYASVTGVNMKSTGQTTLYTIPNTPITSGYKFYVTNVLVKPNTISGFLTPPTIQIGKASSYNEYLTATALTGLDTVGEYKLLQDFNYGGTLSTYFSPGDTIKIDVTAAATGTTVTYDFYLFGIFL